MLVLKKPKSLFSDKSRQKGTLGILGLCQMRKGSGYKPSVINLKPISSTKAINLSRFKFKTQVQAEGEPFENFVTDLKLSVKYCSYPKDEKMVCYHIVFCVI